MMKRIYRWCVPSKAFATDRWAVYVDEYLACLYGLEESRRRLLSIAPEARRLATWAGRTR